MSSAIRQWLEALGLTQYSDRFEANDIDLDVLPSLSEPDLEKLGVSMGHRKKLLKAIAELNGAPAAPVASDPMVVAPGSPSLSPSTVPTGERRQLTVLFSDLVGSTEIAARLDPEDWHRISKEYQQVAAAAVTRFGGHVDKFLGDGLVCFFGVPQAHEDDAERAVRAGLAIVDAMRALKNPP